MTERLADLKERMAQYPADFLDEPGPLPHTHHHTHRYSWKGWLSADEGERARLSELRIHGHRHEHTHRSIVRRRHFAQHTNDEHAHRHRDD